MRLWNDYEGQTIAEAYPLQKLLRPEGRSAFFSTSTNGKPNLIRLTESLNDEHEMLARWRQVSDVSQPNLVVIKTFGKTTFDGVRLTYALMEQSDSSLDEILRERPLTPAETTEVALSVAAALSALHAIDLIHAHVEAVNVLAVGEVIKLRSDCVRECIPDPEFNPPARCQEIRQQDIHDLGVLLFRCLTLERTFHSGVRLPAPFDKLIRRAVEGTCTLAEITQTLSPPAVKPLVPANLLPSAAPTPTVPVSATAPTTKTAPVSSGPAQPVISKAQPQQPTGELPLHASKETSPPIKQMPLPLRAGEPLRLRRLYAAAPAHFRGYNPWLLMAAAALLLLLGVWVFSGSKSPAAPVVNASLDEAPAITAATTAATVAPATPAPAAASTPVVAAPVAAQAQPGWHVIAYTFNHEKQAWQRVAAIQKRHPDLNPRLFHPNGTAPFYVAIGGSMSQAQAETIRNRARRLGLPRDTFARFYQAS